MSWCSLIMIVNNKNIAVWTLPAHDAMKVEKIARKSMGKWPLLDSYCSMNECRYWVRVCACTSQWSCLHSHATITRIGVSRWWCCSALWCCWQQDFRNMLRIKAAPLVVEKTRLYMLLLQRGVLRLSCWSESRKGAHRASNCLYERRCTSYYLVVVGE